MMFYVFQLPDSQSLTSHRDLCTHTHTHVEPTNVHEIYGAYHNGFPANHFAQLQKKNVHKMLVKTAREARSQWESQHIALPLQ